MNACNNFIILYCWLEEMKHSLLFIYILYHLIIFHSLVLYSLIESYGSFCTLRGGGVYLEIKTTDKEIELHMLICRSHQLIDCFMLRKRVCQQNYKSWQYGWHEQLEKLPKKQYIYYLNSLSLSHMHAVKEDGLILQCRIFKFYLEANLILTSKNESVKCFLMYI